MAQTGTVDRTVMRTPDTINKRPTLSSAVHLGDCLDVLRDYPDQSIDLIITSPPYADQRANTYGGIKPDDYVNWFIPRAEQFFRVLKPGGSFVLNIKEKAVNGERHTYVLELILALRKQGWLWTEEYIWHKKTAILENGSTASAMPGNAACTLPATGNSR